MASSMPVSAARAPSIRYSMAVIARICRRLAPMVRSSTLSRIRWYLLMSTDAMSTTIPVAMQYKAMKRMTKPILSSRADTTSRTNPRSMMETFGKAFTTACWYLAECSGDSTRLTRTWNFGAFSSTPAGKSTRKFVWMRFHSTCRRLPTMVAMGVPCTSKVSVSPMRMPLRFASPSSTDIPGGCDLSFQTPVHVPFRIRSEDTRVSLYVTRYSRLNSQGLMGRLESLRRLSILIRFTDFNRMVTMGTVPETSSPSRFEMATMESRWVSWMSKTTMFGWAPEVETFTLSSRIVWMKSTVQKSAVPRPMDMSKTSVWFWGR